MTCHYSVIQFFFWFAFGNILNFASVYLLDAGMTNTQVGVFSAAACALTVLIQPFLAAYADRPDSVSLKTIISAFVGGEVLLGFLLLLGNQENVMVTGVLYAGAILITQILTPFINALGTESARQGGKVDFSVARGIGSVGYAVMAYSMGRLLDHMGSSVHPISMMLVSTALLISVITYPFQQEKFEKKEIGKKETRKNETGKNIGSATAFWKKYPSFGWILAGCVLIYVSHIFLNTFTYQITVDKGGGSAEMGTAMAIAAAAEIITMMLFGVLLKKKGVQFWFRLSGIFFTLKTLGTLLAPNIPTFYGVQIFQILGWGLMAVASVYYVDSIMETEDKVKGQTYMTMTYTIASILGSLFGGRLLDWSGVQGMLIVGTAAGAIGTVMVICTRDSD